MPPLLRPTLLALCLGFALPAPVYAEDAPASEPPTDAAAGQDGEAKPAEATPNAEPRQALDERSSEGAAGLERQLPQIEQQQLQAGDEHFLALWKPANVAEATGVVILVPGADESADWPSAIGPLRSKLPDSGWSTLSLTLPDSPTPPLPEAVLPRPPAPANEAAPAADAADTDKQDSTAGDAPAPVSDAVVTAPPASTPPADPSVRIFARLQAAIAHAEQQGAASIVLLGHGDGAYWAALFIREQKPTQIEHLVTVAAHLPAGQQPPLEELIPGLKLATGDFFYKDLPLDRGAAVKRLQASKRLSHPSYVQVPLKALPGNLDAEQEQLYRRVRGWLEKQLPPKQQPQESAP